MLGFSFTTASAQWTPNGSTSASFIYFGQKVRIGSTTNSAPTQTLDVNDDIAIGKGTGGSTSGTEFLSIRAKTNTWNIGVENDATTAGLFMGIDGQKFLYIDKSQNVGIGTATPLAKFNVAGNAILSGYVSIGRNSIAGQLQALDVYDDIVIGKGGAADPTESEFIGIRGKAQTWHIAVENDNSGFYIGKSGNKKFYIGDNGNIDFGITAGEATNVGVNGNVAATEFQAQNSILFNHAGYPPTAITHSQYGGLIFNLNSDQATYIFQKQSTPIMTLYGTGKVGISTISTGGQLIIEGGMNLTDNGNPADLRYRIIGKGALAVFNTQYATDSKILNINRDWKNSAFVSDFEKVKIFGKVEVDDMLWVRNKLYVRTTPPWADYVFNTEYKLMPLCELEQFISVNRHLPEIPNAAEIEATGIDVAAMSTLQMKKIEELTLYIIDLQKQIEQLKKEVNNLKTE